MFFYKTNKETLLLVRSMKKILDLLFAYNIKHPMYCFSTVPSYILRKLFDDNIEGNLTLLKNAMSQGGEFESLYERFGL